MTNVGKWARWYEGLDPAEPQAYGDTGSYEWIAAHLAPCALVEDWGCGKGWLRRFVEAERYIGVDGTASPFADRVADLADYRSDVPGIAIRHVLEHDYRWHLILENALASARERLAVVLYSPLEVYTRQIDFEVDPGVPVLGFRLEDITDRMREAGWEVTVETMVSSSVNYGRETLVGAIR